MTVIFSDLFNTYTSTPLSQHTPEVGIGWTLLYMTAVNEPVVKPMGASAGSTNVMGPATSETNKTVLHGISPPPSVADIVIQFDRLMNNWAVTNSYATGVFARTTVDGNGKWSGYFLHMYPNNHASASIQLFKRVANVNTLIGQYDHTFVNGDEITFSCLDAAKKVYVNGVEVISSADNEVTGTGHAGIYFGNFLISGHMRAETEYGYFEVEEITAGQNRPLIGSAGISFSSSGTLSTTPGGSNRALTGSSSISFSTSASLNSSSGIIIFYPSHDTFTREGAPSSNYGIEVYLRTRYLSPENYVSYLKFPVSDLTQTVSKALLRLFTYDATDSAGSVYPTSNEYAGGGDWVETGLVANNRPAASGPALDTVGATVVNSWVEWDVSEFIVGNGVYSLLLESSSSDSAFYYSKDNPDPDLRPHLVIEFAKARDLAGAVAISFSATGTLSSSSAGVPRALSGNASFGFSATGVLSNVYGGQSRALAGSAAMTFTAKILMPEDIWYAFRTWFR